MERETIPVTRSSIPSFSDYCQEIKSIWDTRWLTNNGERHQRLQKELQGYLGAANLALFTNGHLALEIALKSLGLTGEVITTPFTFASTTQAIVRCGLTPVFCDITPATYTMDPTKIEALITEKTCAILPVHVYGNLCDDIAIRRIADKYNLKVIYDAAHAFGIKLDEGTVAEMGDISMYSLHATKVYHTIEGGALAYNDAGLTPSLDALRNFGITGPDEYGEIGGNAKMNEFQAAMGLCNLRYIDEYIDARRNAVQRYRKNLCNIPGVQLCPEQSGVQSNYSYFPVVFDGYKYNRDEVAQRLAAKDIQSRRYFYPLTSDFACYGGRFDSSCTPIAKHVAERVLCLPLYAGLMDDDVDRICEVILGRE